MRHFFNGQVSESPANDRIRLTKYCNDVWIHKLRAEHSSNTHLDLNPIT